MDAETLVTTLVVGGVAGWLAGLIMKSGGNSLIGNVIIGVVGAVIGSYLFDVLNISIGSGIIAALVSATAGAVVLLFIIGLIKK